MRALLLPFIASCSLILSGCSAVYSAHPLYTNEDAVEEPALEGKWTPGNDDKTAFCIQKSDGTEYNMVVSEPDSKIIQLFKINLVRLNSDLFADIAFKSQLFDREEVDPPLGTITNHVIVKLDISENDLAYAPLDADVIEKQSKEGSAHLDYLDTNDAMLLTASTEDLRQYISIYSDRLFPEFSHYRRLADDEPTAAAVPCSLPTPP